MVFLSVPPCVRDPIDGFRNDDDAEMVLLIGVASYGLTIFPGGESLGAPHTFNAGGSSVKIDSVWNFLASFEKSDVFYTVVNDGNKVEARLSGLIRKQKFKGSNLPVSVLDTSSNEKRSGSAGGHVPSNEDDLGPLKIQPEISGSRYRTHDEYLRHSEILSSRAWMRYEGREEEGEGELHDFCLR
ncbi:hypothetical protein WN55_03965 [Dufourea novaeangliae]|uniref:Uncharacterized protein n=1 Tax=Dufourea novaeangliae TaxID=178035 RepID=A0A154PMB3_DUFNO|nr:hypothetical protein WN55_03965 [Dufourea novaeangliae]